MPDPLRDLRAPFVDDPPRAYRFVRAAVRVISGCFFRRVEVTGLEHVPPSGGLIVVSWHPNGLVDPALILASLPRQIVFGARHGLFRWPGLGWLLRQVGTVPIYRAVDNKGTAAGNDGADAARRAGNQKSLDALSERLARGLASSLFPEGVSHDEPRPVELKTGVARLHDRALALAPPGSPPPRILPVGLHYDQKDVFRSDALVAFHPPIELPPSLATPPPPDASEEQLRERWRAITDEVERVLHDVVLATEDWSVHHLLHRGRSLLRAERAARAGRTPAAPTIVEKTLGFARLRTGYFARRASDPERTAELRRRVERYDQELRALALEDHELDRDPRLYSRWLPIILFLQAVLVYLLLPPILVVGTLVNLPTALALALVAKVAAAKKKDVATILMLVGAPAFLVTWVVAGVLAARAHALLHAAFPTIPDTPILAGVVVALLGAVGGAVAVRYRRVARETAHAVRARLTRRSRADAIVRLKAERGVLAEAMEELGSGLALPGVIASDGRVKPA